MKTIYPPVLFLLFPLFAFTQSVSPEVISSSGGYYEGTNASLSWTLGELATETLSNGSVILTQGFQQPFSLVIQGIDLDVLVYLEGPFQTGSMSTDLRDEGLLPLSQPYNTPPWNYTGSESVGAIPSGVVDWVLVDLRDATSAANATGATTIEQQAAFLLNDGSVVGLNGTSVLQFIATIANDPFVVVWHRNHLGVLSATALTESGGTYSYDFSTSIGQAYGGAAGYKLIGTGTYGMVGGDGNGDGDIDATDKAIWASDAGTQGYKGGDHNMDAQVNNPDKNDILIENAGMNSQVPD